MLATSVHTMDTLDHSPRFIERRLAVSGWLTGALFCSALLTVAGASEPTNPSSVPSNRTPYIPAACYAKTQTRGAATRNPCYVCHTQGLAPNFTHDEDLQLRYDFASQSESGTPNPWTNLSRDFSAIAREFKAADLLAYVRTNNYQSSSGQLLLTQRLRASLSEAWDPNRNGKWDGYVPDSYFHFDAQGFDRAPDGTLTGWSAFAYAPFPGGFSPANGSFGDAQIRLPRDFQTNETGKVAPQTYAVNLAIVEALISHSNVQIPKTDERSYGVDLDQDGKLGQTSLVAYRWPPQAQRKMSCVGAARIHELPLAAGLFPAETEFLHSLRYLDPQGDGQVRAAARMKELRYSRKTAWQTYAQLEANALREEHERAHSPAKLKRILGNTEAGLSNGQGWIYQGFIEDRLGALRPQSFEETASCIGCHGGIGASTDSTFSFPRKLGAGAFQHGYYSTAERGFDGVPEPKRADGRYEYSLYLEQTRTGDDFGTNPEIAARFFDAAGDLKPASVKKLHTNIALLLLPSESRAVRLNALYRALVEAQTFTRGREPLSSTSALVHTTLAPELPTGVSCQLFVFAGTHEKVDGIFSKTNLVAGDGPAELKRDFSSCLGVIGPNPQDPSIALLDHPTIVENFAASERHLETGGCRCSSECATWCIQLQLVDNGQLQITPLERLHIFRFLGGLRIFGEGFILLSSRTRELKLALSFIHR